MLRLRTIGLLPLGLLGALSGCVGSPTTAPAAAPAVSRQTPTIPAALAEPPSTANRDPEATAPGTAPPCSCSENKPKLKPKPKPKVVLKEPPPQLSTASAVEHMPPGGLIDAQVRSMSVSVMSILGRRVRGANGEDLGRVVDVLADASGRVRTAIIDFGGFLGVGNHRIAVDWPLLRFNPDGTDPSLLLSLSPEKLRMAPEYKENTRPQILMVPTASTAAPAD